MSSFLNLIGASGTPVGAIIQAAAAPDANWLEMNGQAVSKTAYPSLATVLSNDPYQLESITGLITASSSALGNIDNNTSTYSYNLDSQLGFGGGKYWACGFNTANSAVLSSSDGTSWTASASFGAGITLQGILWAYNLSLYVAWGIDSNTGQGAKIWTSPDLVTWTLRFNANSGGTGLSSMAYNGTTLVVIQGKTSSSVVLSQAILTSTNGTSWTYRTLAGTGSIQLTYANSVFWSSLFNLFYASYQDNNTFQIATSPDGITWTSRSTGVGTGVHLPVTRFTQNNYRVIGFSQCRTDTTTAMPVHFTRDTTGTDMAYTEFPVISGEVLADAVTIGNRTISVARSGKVFLVDDIGLEDVTPTNKLNSSGAPATFYRVRNINGMFVIMATSSGYAMSSYDGRTWEPFLSMPWSSGVHMREMLYANNKLIILSGQPAIYTGYTPYSQTNYFWLPKRTANGLPFFIKAK